MNALASLFREWFRDVARGWNCFWFTPADAATLGLTRILAGAMLFYTHLVWSLDLEAFFGPDSWVSPEAARVALANDGTSFDWSWFWWIESPTPLWIVHGLALVAFATFTLGLWTRTSSVLVFLAALSYANRQPGALFGLDQINVMLATYLMLAPCGDAYSLDRWRAARKAGAPLAIATPSVSTGLATRLIQVHMCLIYFFAGLSKLQGVTWWQGTALWYSFANLEYQSLDMTWLGSSPHLIAAMTLLTVFWELSFCALVWPRLTRPVVLAIAVPLHLGIAFCLGMMTFGWVMLFGCLAFVPPRTTRVALALLATIFGLKARSEHRGGAARYS